MYLKVLNIKNLLYNQVVVSKDISKEDFPLKKYFCRLRELKENLCLIFWQVCLLYQKTAPSMYLLNLKRSQINFGSIDNFFSNPICESTLNCDTTHLDIPYIAVFCVYHMHANIAIWNTFLCHSATVKCAIYCIILCRPQH